MHLLKSMNLQHSPPLTLMHCLNSLHFTPISHKKRDLLILRPDGASQILPSPCPTAAWDQQWWNCGTGGSGLMQPVCCPGLAWPPPETSPPSPAGTPHPPGAVAVTATASKHPTFVSKGRKKECSDVWQLSVSYSFYASLKHVSTTDFMFALVLLQLQLSFGVVFCCCLVM